MVPARVHPVSPRPGLRQGAVDTGPAAADRRGPDRLRDRPADRGQPALVPPLDPRHVRQGRWRLDQLGRTLDGRGRASCHRAAGLPHRHAQHRPGAPRARPDDAAPAGLRPRRPEHPPRPGLCRVPGAGDADSHRNTGRYSDDPVADRIMVRIAADENLHMVFYRDILAAALKIQPSAAVRAIVDEILAFEMPGAAIPGSCARPRRSPRPGSTTCASTATRSSCRSSGTGGCSSSRGSTRPPERAAGLPSTSRRSTSRPTVRGAGRLDVGTAARPGRLTRPGHTADLRRRQSTGAK